MPVYSRLKGLLSDPNVRAANALNNSVPMPSSNDVGRGTNLLDQAYNSKYGQLEDQDAEKEAAASEANLIPKAKILQDRLKNDPELADAINSLKHHVGFNDLINGNNPVDVISGGPESSANYNDMANENADRVQQLKKLLGQ